MKPLTQLALVVAGRDERGQDGGQDDQQEEDSRDEDQPVVDEVLKNRNTPARRLGRIAYPSRAAWPPR